jgi:hypothetical protein
MQVHQMLPGRASTAWLLLLLLQWQLQAIYVLQILLLLLLLLLWHWWCILLLRMLWQAFLIVLQLRLLDVLHALAVLHGPWPLAAAAGAVSRSIDSSTCCPIVCSYSRNGLLHVLGTLGAAAAPSA